MTATATESATVSPTAGHERGTEPEENEAHPHFMVRRVQFAWADVPVHWLPEDPVAAQVMNVLHVLLPPGEKWFVEVYRDVLPRIGDPVLRREMKAFMGQEAVHGRTHAGFVDHLEDSGYDPAPLARRLERTVDIATRLGRRTIGRRRTDDMLVATIAGIEHYTAVLGEWALVSDVFDRSDPTMADILRWHGAEELEHKCVAFDVMQEVTGASYGWRLAGYLMASFQMARLWPICTAHLIEHDPLLRHLSPRQRRREVWRSFRRRNLPGRALARPLVQYFKPTFHPSHHATLALARTFLVTSPAVRAIDARTRDRADGAPAAGRARRTGPAATSEQVAP